MTPTSRDVGILKLHNKQGEGRVTNWLVGLLFLSQKCQTLEMPRVLFVIGGFGLGNSTRCAAIIEKLHAQRMNVDVATSSNGLWYFSDSASVNEVFPLEPLSYQRRKGRISYLSTLLDIPRLFFSLFANAIRILRLQRQNHYSFIATDSEYSCFLARFLLFVPLVSVNNVFFTFSDLIGQLPRLNDWRIWPALTFEYFDFLIQTYLSDFRIAPVLRLDRTTSNEGTLYCPPLVRSGFQKSRPSGKLRSALVIASGSGIGVSENTVAQLAKCEEVHEIRVVGLSGYSEGKIKYLGRQKDISSYLVDSDFIVSNGGFSTISEAIVSSRPMLLIPIENHFEQIQNARYVESLGLGLMTSDDSIAQDYLKLSESSNEMNANWVAGNGAEIAAKALVSLGMQSEFSYSVR